jgi:hypothetical protein
LEFYIDAKTSQQQQKVQYCTVAILILLYSYLFLIIQHQTLLSKSTGINDICILGYESAIHAMNQYCMAGLQQFNITRDLSNNVCDQNQWGNARYV